MALSTEEAASQPPMESKNHYIGSFVSGVPKPLLVCLAFVAGLFIASITFNLGLYWSLRSRGSTYSGGALVGGAAGVYKNIVSIEVQYATYDRTMPWQTMHATFQRDLKLASAAAASGLILEKGLILTSAYVATDSYLVTVLRQGTTRKFQAEVVAHATELDLALLSVKDEAFWQGVDVSIELDAAAEILGRGNEVVVAGFPVGEELSISKLSARVARVEAEASGFESRYGSYPQTVLSLYPAIGTDLTVGPVFKESDNKLIGFIGANDKVVPVKTIASFVKAHHNNHSAAGSGSLGMLYRPMRSLAMRMYWDLPTDDGQQIGVQIRSIDPASPLHGRVQKGDVLVAIDGEAVLANGAVNYRKSVDNMGQINDVALPFAVLLAEKAIGDEVKLSFRRASESTDNDEGRNGYKKVEDFDAAVTMGNLKPLAPRTLNQKVLEQPTYFMLGGLVWTVFTEELVRQSHHTGGVHVPSATLALAMHRWRQNPDEQIVVLLRTMEHPCNKWYESGNVRVLKFFNGKPVVNMKQFLSSVSTALQEKEELLKFTFTPLDDDDAAGSENDPDMVLDTAICAGADKALIESGQVQSAASPDLAKIYQTLPEEFTLMPEESQASESQTATPEHSTEKAAVPEAAEPLQKTSQKEALKGPAKKSQTVVKAEESNLFEQGTKYNPINMKGQPRTQESSVTKCQRRCASVAGCAHFSYWVSGGGCHLQDSSATPASDSKSIAGPPTGSQAPSGRGGGMHGLPWTNVVQIRLVTAERDFISPWKMSGASAARCSAIIVSKSKRMILTNSHCVGNVVALDVVREDVPVPVAARVVEIAHDVDLAWITTDSDSFWASDNIQETVHMAEGLPYISHAVRVVGYPRGGSSISITEGVVSRIDAQIYPNGLVGAARNTPDELLIVQVDAAINPGNSGGPVFDSQGNLVGLAFAAMLNAQSVGYVIPHTYLRNFVASVSSEKFGNRWKAQSEVGAIFEPVQNPGMRKFLNLDDHETGVQVRTIAPDSPLSKQGIVKGDVMLKIDGMSVQGSGKVQRDFNGKKVTLPFDSVVTEKPHGDTTSMEFVHFDMETGEKTRKSFEAVFHPIAPLVPRFYDAPMSVKGREHFAAQPTYFVLWGLVWGVFSNPVYQQALHHKKEVPWSVVKSAMHKWRSNDDEEVVVLLQGLGTACTMSYSTDTMRILEYFNGKRIRNMRDLARYAMEAEVNQEAFMRITFAPLADVDIAGSDKDPDIVLHRSFCAKTDAEAIEANNIPGQCSDDVLGYVKEALQDLGQADHAMATPDSDQIVLLQQDVDPPASLVQGATVLKSQDTVLQGRSLRATPFLKDKLQESLGNLVNNVQGQAESTEIMLNAMGVGSTEGIPALESTVPTKGRMTLDDGTRISDDTLAQSSIHGLARHGGQAKFVRASLDDAEDRLDETDAISNSVFNVPGHGEKNAVLLAELVQKHRRSPMQPVGRAVALHRQARSKLPNI